MGQPWKNLHKDVLYTVGKINGFFNGMVHLDESGRGVKFGQDDQSELHVL